MDHLTRFAIDVARSAGRLLMDHYGTSDHFAVSIALPRDSMPLAEKP